VEKISKLHSKRVKQNINFRSSNTKIPPLPPPPSPFFFNHISVGAFILVRGAWMQGGGVLGADVGKITEIPKWSKNAREILARKTTLETGGEYERTTLETGGEDGRTPLETGGEDETTPLETSVNDERTPLQTSVKDERTPLQTSVKDERTPLQTSVKDERTPLQTSVKDEMFSVKSEQIKSEDHQPIQEVKSEDQDDYYLDYELHRIIQGPDSEQGELLDEHLEDLGQTPLETSVEDWRTPLETSVEDLRTPLERGGEDAKRQRPNSDS
jgi:hypothetical protein